MLVLGEEPQKYGLSISLLERLYDHYQELEDVAKPYCAHLTTNFRCLPAIVNLARQVAYKKPLTSDVSEHSAHPDAPFPLLFVCTSLDRSVKETKDSRCKVEVDAALQEASRFFMKWPASIWGKRDLREMCFLSPCSGQVCADVKVNSNLYVIFIFQVTLARNSRWPPQVEDVEKLTTYRIQGKYNGQTPWVLQKKNYRNPCELNWGILSLFLSQAQVLLIPHLLACHCKYQKECVDITHS